VEKFLADAKARQLSHETIRKYQNLLGRRFGPWCSQQGYRLLDQLTVDRMRDFRAGWNDGPTYATKNLERMRAFFRFCVQSDWLPKNPAQSIKAPKTKVAPTLPFTSEEMTRILAACEQYPGDAVRMKAFVLTMRHSGLRIGDTLALDAGRLKDGKLFLYTQKTGTPVLVPLPPIALKALKELNVESGRFFTSGRAKPGTARSNWSRYLETVFELAGVEGGHSHRFRDTFAVSLLESGVSLENLSILLGHSSVKVTERHYKPWVQSLQDKLEADVARSWDSEPEGIEVS
jgi:site-specific recombinase XerD